MKKIVCITGTRPQLIKHAVLLKEAQKCFSITSLYTGQHYQHELNTLLKNDLFDDSPFHNLTLEQTKCAASRLGEMIQKIAAVLRTNPPDAVVVYGDTDTTLAGALAATKCSIPLVHIEAGERSHNLQMPEEENRRLTDMLASVLFCVSEAAIQNLKWENAGGTAFCCGDVMKDLLLQTAQLFQKPILLEPYYFCTIHRSYTKQNRIMLSQLLDSLGALRSTVIFPVHPATQQTINELENKSAHKNICFLPPVSYNESIHYQKFARAVLTDSGGIQKEAYWLQRPCITIRKETEWKDTLNGNWNQLAYNDLSILPQLLQVPKGDHNAGLYGSGHAAACIVRHLKQLF
jgi:UDP-N-acetylglucosamine 2-epimerase